MASLGNSICLLFVIYSVDTNNEIMQNMTEESKVHLHKTPQICDKKYLISNKRGLILPLLPGMAQLF